MARYIQQTTFENVGLICNRNCKRLMNETHRCCTNCYFEWHNYLFLENYVTSDDGRAVSHNVYIVNSSQNGHYQVSLYADDYFE